LPLWKGPTMAMHRGPMADLPFVAMLLASETPCASVGASGHRPPVGRGRQGGLTPNRQHGTAN
jgi:hypothetical protein